MTERHPPDILIFGATGTLGHLVALELAPVAERVRLASRSRPTAFPDHEHAAVDVTTGAGLPEALAGITRLFLVTPDMDHQMAAELRIVAAAREAGVNHVVKISAVGAADRDYILGRAHRAVELALASSGMTHTILRPSAFMQNFATYYLPGIKATGEVRLPCGKGAVSFIDARDIAALAAKALVDADDQNRAFEMFGPEALTYAAAAQIVAAVAGAPIGYRPISDLDYRQIVGDGVTAERIIDLYHLYRGGHAAGPAFDLASHIGRPLLRLQDFAADYRRFFAADNAPIAST